MMESQPENEKIELKQRLARALRVPSNKICADCPETRPTWISFIKPQQKFALGSKVLASFVCLECAGLHRKLGTHICVVRSISHDQFEEKDVECVEYSGNEVVNEIFEGHLQKSTMDGINIKPVLGAEVARRERFIRQKYVDLYFYRKRAHYEHIAEVNKLMATVRKPFKSAADKETPTKPIRKKLKKFLNEDPLSSSDRDALTLACSTTVGNTTATNTSRTRTLTDREESIPSDSPFRRTMKKVATKMRSSKSNRTPNSNNMSSQEKVTDPMFGIPFGEEGNTLIGETSTPEKQANVRSDLQSKDPVVPITTTNTTIKDRGRSDLSGMVLVFDEDLDTDLTQRKNQSANELDAYRRTEVAKQTMEEIKLQNNLLGGFTKKPIMKTTSDERDKREVHTISPRDVRRTRSEITMDQIARKHEGSLSMHLEREKEIQAAVKKVEGRQVPLTKDTSTRKLNIPYMNSVPMSTTSVEGIVSVDTSFGFGDHTVTGMSGTGETVDASGVEPSICTVNGFRSVAPEIEKPESKGSFTEKFQNKKEADGAIKEQTQRSLIRSHLDEFCDETEDFIEINKSNRSLNKSNPSLLKQRSIRSIGEEPTARIYLQRQKSQTTMDCDSPPTKKKRSSRSLTNKSKSTNKAKSKSSRSRSRSLSNKYESSMGIDKSATRKKGRRPKSLDPSSSKKTKKKKSSRSLTKSPTQKKKKSSRYRSLSESPTQKKKKSSKSLTKSPSQKKKKSIRSLTDSPSKKKKKSIRSLTDSPSKKKTKKVKKSVRSLTNSPSKEKKKKKIKKSTRSLSNKSSTSIGNDDHAVRKRLRKPKSKSNMDCASPASAKGEKRVKKRIKKSRSKSRSRNKDDGMKALLDEWERLKDENKREFDRMRREKEKIFADFDRHFSQHVSILC